VEGEVAEEEQTEHGVFGVEDEGVFVTAFFSELAFEAEVEVAAELLGDGVVGVGVVPEVHLAAVVGVVLVVRVVLVVGVVVLVVAFGLKVGVGLSLVHAWVALVVVLEVVVVGVEARLVHVVLEARALSTSGVLTYEVEVAGGVEVGAAAGGEFVAVGSEFALAWFSSSH
jgi:hypothetical protein